MTGWDRENLHDCIDALSAMCNPAPVENVAEDAYNHACDEMERWQQTRRQAGKQVGTTHSLCDGIAWLYSYVDQLEERLGVGKQLSDDLIKTEAARHLGEDVVDQCGLTDIREFAHAIEAATRAEQNEHIQALERKSDQDDQTILMIGDVGMNYAVNDNGMVVNTTTGTEIPQIKWDNPIHPMHYRWHMAWNRRLIFAAFVLAGVFRIFEVGAVEALGNLLGLVMGVAMVLFFTALLLVGYEGSRVLARWLRGG